MTIEANDQAVALTDACGRVVTFNAAAERLCGWSAADAVGELATEFVPPEYADTIGEIQEVISKGRSWSGELVLTRRDGTRFPAEVTATPVFDEAGRLMFVVGIGRDLSGLREAEEAAQTLFAIISSSADAIFTKSLDGTILSWNRGAERLYRYPADEVIGRHVTLLDPQQTHAEIQGLLAAVAAGETVHGLETVRRRRDGTHVDVSLGVSPIFDEQGDVVAASVIARDISAQRALERQLARLATHDDLTGLPNRTLLDDRLGHAVTRSARRRRPLAVLLVDVDRFNDINAAWGYVAGDQVLVEVAARLQAGVSAEDTVARLGGDRFVVLSEETDDAAAVELAGRLAAAIAAAMVVSDTPLAISASIGIAVSPPLDAESDILLRYAAAAMYQAKAAGPGNWRTFHPSEQPLWSQRLELGEELRGALSRDELQVHYQPVVQLATGRLLGIEALVRWEHPTRGWVPPNQFVPLAEDIGLIAALDQWVLERACRDAALLLRTHVVPADTYFAINVSARNISDPALPGRVSGAAEAAGLPLSALELEVTETGLIADRRAARQILASLRELGVGIALDDFGTGYAQLTYLRQFPISTIKVDRQFIQHITASAEDFAITASVIDLGRAIGLRTVAEGLETTEQLAILHRLGCDAGQGFLWSKALAREDLTAMLRDGPGFVAAMAGDGSTRLVKKRKTAITNEHGLHRIVQLHRSGASLATIAAALNAENYPSPTHQRWHSASVARVITDLAYAAQKRQPARQPRQPSGGQQKREA